MLWLRIEHTRVPWSKSRVLIRLYSPAGIVMAVNVPDTLRMVEVRQNATRIEELADEGISGSLISAFVRMLLRSAASLSSNVEGRLGADSAKERGRAKRSK